MDHLDKDMHDLVAKGKSQGYLTYDEVTRVLTPTMKSIPTSLIISCFFWMNVGLSWSRNRPRVNSSIPPRSNDGG